MEQAVTLYFEQILKCPALMLVLPMQCPMETAGTLQLRWRGLGSHHKYRYVDMCRYYVDIM